MKTIFRFLSLGIILTGVMAVGAVSGFAQDPCSDTDTQTKLQDRIREIYQKDKPGAIESGKQLLEKFGSCEFSKEFNDWLKPQLPKWESSVAKQREAEARKGILTRFDAAVPAKNWDAAYAAGNEFFSKFSNDPARINLMVPLGLIGFYESYSKNYKYNDDTVKYARTAISLLKDPSFKGTKPNDKFGAFQFEYSRPDAISELNYAVGYITYWAKGDKKGALPFYLEALQNPGTRKDDPYAYATIGDFYSTEVTRLGKEYAAEVAKRDPNATPEAITAQEEKIKQVEGMLKAYLERAIDAYSRAYKFTKADAANKQSRDGLYKTLQELYKLRFQKEDGLDAYIAQAVTKPMPNPLGEVTPVRDEPTTTTGSTTTGLSAAATAVNIPASATVGAAKPVSNGKAPATGNATPAKKPVAKKPGTR